MNLAAWIPLFAVGVVFSAAMLWHLATHQVGFMSKTAWALLIILVMPVGSIIYFLISVAHVGVQRADAEGRLDATPDDEPS